MAIKPLEIKINILINNIFRDKYLLQAVFFLTTMILYVLLIPDQQVSLVIQVEKERKKKR